MACSTSFSGRNSVFLSQQFSRNSVFQPVSAKVQTSERALEGELEWREERKLENKCTGKTQEDEQGQMI